MECKNTSLISAGSLLHHQDGDEKIRRQMIHVNAYVYNLRQYRDPTLLNEIALSIIQSIDAIGEDRAVDLIYRNVVLCDIERFKTATNAIQVIHNLIYAFYEKDYGARNKCSEILADLVSKTTNLIHRYFLRKLPPELNWYWIQFLDNKERRKWSACLPICVHERLQAFRTGKLVLDIDDAIEMIKSTPGLTNEEIDKQVIRIILFKPEFDCESNLKIRESFFRILNNPEYYLFKMDQPFLAKFRDKVTRIACVNEPNTYQILEYAQMHMDVTTVEIAKPLVPFVHDELLVPLLSFRNLTKLMVSNCSITRIGIKLINGILPLRELSLIDLPEISDKDMDSLIVPWLEKLGLALPQLSNRGLKCLSLMHSLKFLFIIAMPEITDQFLDQFRNRMSVSLGLEEG